MQEEKICPYPGLRPFNEEESIFFRGREEHIDKIISQLEEKKFVMLTGASGDGKSSLVYAGVIPNARAGFFKAKFNNWLIADFRPERTPLKNLSIALSSKLNLAETAVEKELNFGFSALINLYKKSAFHLDYTNINYKAAAEDEKKKLKRKAANLFILVDQFEEFFTNPENYLNGQASNESQLVVNLLLETARIALAEDLPIYIVCTMRSDYIGQCAAFRGLPEYIGYSQFFVPRLKRKEIHQVIEEPASLSGNAISNRLVETLINEIGDGFDQLPVLQHALNRVWNKTNKGAYEMDLLHLAMIGGLPPDQLPENDRQVFDGWFQNVSVDKKLFFKKAALDAVLNAHAYELYETAHEYYNAHHSEKIEKEEAQLIIKTAFQCLTKIDESRAVRNRMSLQEIANIINDASISVEKVDGVLTLFRLQGNTFIKPFASIDQAENQYPSGAQLIPETPHLLPETVLDITHESLIRNWDLLDKWAKEENENWLTFQDFNKQLQRWLANDKAKGFLLPIGPLSFFENWYNSCKPNKYWLARYDESNLPQEEKLQKAEETLQAANQFIGTSARNLFFSRTVLKYGAGKLIAALGLLLLVGACTYYYFDFRKKQNNTVIDHIADKGFELLASPDVALSYKADFLINTERLNETEGITSYTTFENLLNGLENDSMAFDIGYTMLNQCKTIKYDDSLAYDKQGILGMKVFTYLFHRFENDANTQLVDLSKKKNVTIKLKRINDFLWLCALMKDDYKKKDSAAVEAFCEKTIWLVNNLLVTSLKELQKKDIAIDIDNFNYCISLLLAIDNKPEYTELLKYMVSDIDTVHLKIENLYWQNEKYLLSCSNIGDGYNEILGMLYATECDRDTSVMKKIIKLVSFNQRKIKDYRPYNIYYALVKNSHLPLKRLDPILNVIVEKNEHDTKLNFFQRLAMESGNTFSFSEYEKNRNLSNYFISSDRKEEIWNYCLFQLTKTPIEKINLVQLNEENYIKFKDSTRAEIANYFKVRGTYCYEVKHNIKEANLCFNKMMNIYGTLSNSFLQSFREDIENYKWLLSPYLNTRIWRPQKDDCNAWQIADYSNFFKLVYSNAFSDYIVRRKNIFNSDQFEKSVLPIIDWSIPESFNQFSNLVLSHEKKLHMKIMSDGVHIDTMNINTDFYILCPLIEIIQSFEKGDTALALKIFRNNIDDLSSLSNDKRDFRELLEIAIKKMVQYGFKKESLELLGLIKNDDLRRDLLIEICYTLQTEGPVENTFIYLDKLFEGLTRETGAGRRGLFRVLGKIGGEEINAIAQTLLRKTPELIKPSALQNLIKGVAERGNYYEALLYMPEYISESKELKLYNEILKAEILKRENKIAKNASKGNWNDAPFFEISIGSNKDGDGYYRFSSLD